MGPQTICGLLAPQGAGCCKVFYVLGHLRRKATDSSRLSSHYQGCTKQQLRPAIKDAAALAHLNKYSTSLGKSGETIIKLTTSC